MEVKAEINQDSSEKVVRINRVSKVAKGGRQFSFNALVVVGDRAGSVALGSGKANEVPEAVRKAIDKARRNMIPINTIKGSILPHRVEGKFKSSKVMLSPASPGTGLIADEAVRSVLEQLGISDALTKVVGSKNTLNVVRATLAALSQLETPLQSARKRGISLDQLFERDPEEVRKKAALQETAKEMAEEPKDTPQEDTSKEDTSQEETKPVVEQDIPPEEQAI